MEHRCGQPADAVTCEMLTLVTADDQPLEARILAFMGQFSQTQFIIDWAIELYFQDRTPGAIAKLRKTFLKNMNDSHRIDMLEAVAADVGYSGDLSAVRDVFNRAKQTRDFIGHAQGVGNTWNSTTQSFEVFVTHERDRRRPLVPDPILPDTFDQLQEDCRWISDHTIRIIFEGSLSKIINFSGEPSQPPLPPPHPR